MAQHHKKVIDYAINELNRKNTYEQLDCPEFRHAGYRFRFGFWPSEVNGGTHPFMAMIVWTPQGWKTIDTGIFLYNADIRLDDANSSVEEDLKDFMWHVGQTFTKAFVAFLSSAPVRDKQAIEEITSSPLELVVRLLSTAKVTSSGELDFDREL